MPEKVKITRYDIDEITTELVSNNAVTDLVSTKFITRVEAILYSNPRWGTPATNKFTFARSVKTEPKSDLFKDWPRKQHQRLN